jgi:hypothetical protein
MLRHVSLVLPNINIVEPGFIASLLLDILSHFTTGKDPVALEGTIYRSESALIDLIATL